jgi:hypothetical protein
MRIRSTILMLCGALLVGCNASQEPEQQPAAATPFSNQATMVQLMNWVYEPHAQIVWSVGGTIITAEGQQQVVPKNDDEWNAVRNAAATIAESGNVLMIPGRARDTGDWIKYARLMIDKANECVQAAEAKDLDAFFTSGSDLYLACNACHAQYLIGEPLKPEDMPK